MPLSATLPVDSREVRRRMQEARRQLERSPQFRRGRSECPAGRFIAMTRDGTAGCLCAVEGEPISLASQPASLVDFCFGDHTRCPTWQAERRRVMAGRRTPLAEISLARPRRELQPVGDDESVLAIEGERPGRDSR